jgi:DNA-directed RNA polymerase sigma subunit (sigma70/sigma32)
VGKPANQTKSITVESNINISMSYEEISNILGITIKEVKAAEASAIRKLRHPRTGMKLKKYLNM